MILVDASVWIDHIRSSDEQLSHLLSQGEIATHPFVIGEVLLGSLKSRDAVRTELLDLRQTTVADDEEVLALIEQRKLFGTGLGYVDSHLLASSLLTKKTALWTRDKRLREVAVKLGVAARLEH